MKIKMFLKYIYSIKSQKKSGKLASKEIALDTQKTDLNEIFLKPRTLVRPMVARAVNVSAIA